ncbi:lipopolysaccharide biosynthesis protein [Bradyrhizobium sp. 23AC]
MNLKRVSIGVAANVYDKLVIAGVQLLIVPVLAVHWGVEAYGAWVILAAVPSFLSVSDLGFATAAGNQMTMLAARGRHADTVRVFQSAWVVILASSLLAVLGALLIVWGIPSAVWPSFSSMTPSATRVTLSLLIVYAIVSLQGSIFMAGFRCAGLFALGAFWSANTILFENVCMVAVVVLGYGPEYAAVTLVVARFLALLVQNLLLRINVPWLKIGFEKADRVEALGLLKPALAVLAVPLGQAAFLQGTTLALGAALSSAAVPVFTATRTFSRIGIQLTQLLTHAIMPEFSAAVARKDRRSEFLIVLLTVSVALAVALPFAILLVLFGPQLIALWTRQLIIPSRELIALMALTVVLGGFWNPLSNLILAINRHAGFAFPFLLLSALTMPVTFVCSRIMGPTGAALSVAFLDVIMCLVIAKQARRLFYRPDNPLQAVGAYLAGGLTRLKSWH